MPSYYLNEAMFVLPEKGFVDRTVHRLESAAVASAGDASANPLDALRIEVRRRGLEREKSLRGLVHADIATSKVEVNGFTILDEVEGSLGDAPALFLRTRSRARDAVYYQLQAHVACGPTWMTFLVTAPDTERVRCDEVFDRIVETLAFRARSASGTSTTSYQMTEATFDLFESTFVDRTFYALEAKLEGGDSLGVFVHRRPFDAGKSLRQLVEDNIALNQTRLSAYAVLDEAQAVVGGLPAILLRTRWRHEGRTFYQLQAHTVFDARLMIFAVSGPLGAEAACNETFDSLVATLTFRVD